MPPHWDNPVRMASAGHALAGGPPEDGKARNSGSGADFLI
jgi:hypothetical protein